MTVEQAIETLKNYPCVCKYGTSPIKCTDTECDFGKAIRILVNEVENEKNSVKISMVDNIINDEERGLI